METNAVVKVMLEHNYIKPAGKHDSWWFPDLPSNWLLASLRQSMSWKWNFSSPDFLFIFLFFLLFFFFNYLPITLIVLHLLLNISNSARSLGCKMNNYIKSLSHNLFFPLFFCLYRKFLATTLQTTVPDGWHVSSSSHCPKWIWKVNPPPSCAAVIVFLPAEPQAWLGCKSEFLTSF